MNYPKLKIDLQILKENVKNIVKLCNDEGILVVGVTKVFCGNPTIANAYLEGGVSYLADSRIENLIRLRDFDIPKILTRLPMISEVERTVQYADISLNSEIDTIRALSEAALKLDKTHNIVLMVDLGDLREGYFHKETLFNSVEETLKLQGVKIIGLGTNLTCYGGLIPTNEILDKFIKLGEELEEKYHIELKIISGGNSSSLHLLGSYKSERLNNFRLGESLVLGIETAYGKQIKGTRNDAFILQVEIIEIKEKPSVPYGNIGLDAFGNKPKFVDRGIRKRAICAIGKQDMDFGSLYPIDEDIIVLGGSSDHLILDISDSKVNYKVGEKVEFKLSYAGILRAMTSEYVKKEIVD
ncbi:MAG: ornithine racemase Orr [Tissierellaceae bacterium]|nr:ornithine racemase Orr [Tissierellaceae bacterium]